MLVHSHELEVLSVIGLLTLRHLLAVHFHSNVGDPPICQPGPVLPEGMVEMG